MVVLVVERQCMYVILYVGALCICVDFNVDKGQLPFNILQKWQIGQHLWVGEYSFDFYGEGDFPQTEK